MPIHNDHPIHRPKTQIASGRRPRTCWIMLLALLIAGAGCLAPSLVHAESSFRIGLDEVQLTGATYTHDTSGTKLTNSDTMIGTQLMVEFLPTDFFGIEVDYAISPLQRHYQLGTNGATSNNVSEQASYTTYGANFYMFREEKRGLHPTFGVATGQIAVSQKFEAGTLGNQTTNNTVDVNILKLGLEWVLNRAGVRLQYQAWSGDASNSTKLTNVRQTNSYTGSALALGVFALF